MFFLKKLGAVFSRPAIDPAVQALYRACIAQSRSAFFYQALAVPDTVDGRFDLLLLHVILVMRRLGTKSALRQQLFDLMFADMDRNLREMGVGDMSVGKKIKPMLGAFYGRFQAYESGLANDNTGLIEALRRNIYNNGQVEEALVARLAVYVQAVVDRLDQTYDEALAVGEIAFPEVAR